jgi:acyl-CoA reductase-like NAD-dependent aldehyde dehydrogenase
MQMSSTASGVERTGILIDGKWESGIGTFDVTEKFTGKILATVARASIEQVNKAVDAAKRSFANQPLEPYRRYEILLRASALVEQRRRELVQTIVAESGFTVSDAAVEVNRCIQTLMISAEEAKRIAGEMVPIESAPGQAHRMAFTIRVPRGVICAITPFNSPLNTVTHKVAPALAAGNTVVLKPSSYTPLTAAILCEILIEAGLPPAHINLVNGPGGEIGRWLAANPEIKFYAFTGSTAVGKALHQAVDFARPRWNLGVLPQPSCVKMPTWNGLCHVVWLRAFAKQDRFAHPCSDSMSMKGYWLGLRTCCAKRRLLRRWAIRTMPIHLPVP